MLMYSAMFDYLDQILVLIRETKEVLQTVLWVPQGLIEYITQLEPINFGDKMKKSNGSSDFSANINPKN